jgi:hypothetical protein
VNASRFDALTRLVANRVTRRRMLRATTGAVLAARLGVPKARPRPVSASTLAANPIIDATAYFENAAGAYSPSGALPGGRLIVSLGQNGTNHLIYRSLVDGSGAFDAAAATTGMTLPVEPEQAVSTDNQIVRLADGAMLIARNGCIWSDFPAGTLRPPWFDETKIKGCGAYRARQRGAVPVFRSQDGVDWTQVGVIDFAVAAGGAYGAPRPYSNSAKQADVKPIGTADSSADPPEVEQDKDASGNLHWWIGGGDRTELYACPFTGNVYVSFLVAAGPYGGDPPALVRTCLVFVSHDRGETWELITEDLPDKPPVVMTSTPDGRLFLVQATGGGKLRVNYSIDPVGSTGVPALSAPFEVAYL